MAISRDQNAAMITRAASSVADETFNAAEATVTSAQMASLIAQAADRWRQEDIAAVVAA